MHPTFDERDAAILAERQAMFDARGPDPREGDFVDFADGVIRRVSHIWRWEADAEGPAVYSVQTSAPNGCGYHLSEGHVSFSGSLYQGVPGETLTRTDETREGCVWFFHHGRQQAHNGVQAMAKFRVYRASVEAPR